MTTQDKFVVSDKPIFFFTGWFAAQSLNSKWNIKLSIVWATALVIAKMIAF